MNKFYLLLLCFIVNSAFVNLSYGAMESSAKQRIKTKLLDKDMVRVIVTFDEAAREMSSAKASSDRFRAAKKLGKMKRENAKKRKPSKHLKIAREFKHLPSIVYDVDAEGLQELIDDPNITVHENRIARPSLAQSVKRVYSSQKYSPYHGNNEWAVAVIDTGVNKNHPMLSGKVVSEACYSTTYSNNAMLDPDERVFSLCPGGVQSSTAPGSGLDCSTSIIDCGHGTQMAGIAVGDTTNRLGVAKDGKIIAIKVASQGQRFDECPGGISPCDVVIVDEGDIMAGLDRVFDLRNTYKIASVNLSLNFRVGATSTACDDDTLKPYIDMLRNVGIPTVVSAGNDGMLGFLGNPACISTTFSVGATNDNSDALWVDTNGSELMDMFAPGVNITTSFGGAGYKTVSGTSASAAHVSGAWVAARHAWPLASVGQLENLIRGKGPVVYTPEPGKFKRRLDLRSILDSIDPGSQINPLGFLPAVNFILLDD